MTERERRELERLARTTEHQIQAAAERRGHPQRTRYAAVGAGTGAALGSFGGPVGALLGGALGGFVGAALGNEEDDRRRQG